MVQIHAHDFYYGSFAFPVLFSPRKKPEPGHGLSSLRIVRALDMSILDSNVCSLYNRHEVIELDGQKPNIPSKEEIELIRDYCLMPLLLDLVEKNKKDMEFTDHTLKPLYIKAADALWKRIHADLYEIRKELKRIGCKVNKLDRYDPAAIHFEFRLRGYREEFGIMKMLVKSEMSMRLGNYIAGMFKPSTQ